MCCEQRFATWLRESGLRLTPQREMVLLVMHDLEGHASVEEIYALVQERSSAVDVSTVYRTLELLQELHLVAAVDLGDGQSRYELLSVHGPHHHLQCRSCGKLLWIEQAELGPLVAELTARWAFQPELGHLIIPGICAECLAASSKEAPAAQASPAVDASLCVHLGPRKL